MKKGNEKSWGCGGWSFPGGFLGVSNLGGGGLKTHKGKGPKWPGELN